jgi:hypothetical protein
MGTVSTVFNLGTLAQCLSLPADLSIYEKEFECYLLAVRPCDVYPMNENSIFRKPFRIMNQ